MSFFAYNIRQEIQDFENLMIETNNQFEDGAEQVEVDLSYFMDIFGKEYMVREFEEYFNVEEDYQRNNVLIVKP